MYTSISLPLSVLQLKWAVPVTIWCVSFILLLGRCRWLCRHTSVSPYPLKHVAAVSSCHCGCCIASPLPLLQVTTETFTANFKLDTAGAVYYVITDLESPAVPVAPGSAVLASGVLGQPELLPAPIPKAYAAASVTVRGDDSTVDVHTATATRRRLSSEPAGQGAGTLAGTTPWHVAPDREGSYLQGDWAGAVTHRYVLQLSFVVRLCVQLIWSMKANHCLSWPPFLITASTGTSSQHQSGARSSCVGKV